jgi:predicted RNase H-like nuclease (RuvC/YqgF family)
MAEPEKKREKKSRPKSEVVKSGEKRSHKSSHKTDPDGPDREKTKRSHSHRKDRSHVKSDGGNADELRKELETTRAEVSQLNERVAALQREKEELAAKAKNSSASSSSEDGNKGEALAKLRSQLEEEKATVAQLQQLQGSIEELKAENAKKDKALEAEFNKYKDLQGQVHSLSDKLSHMERENEDLRSKTPSSNSQAVVSPRGGGDGNLPAWKLREIERQREAEEQREREQRAKLQKVQSLRAVRNEVIVSDPITTNFKDPVLNKPNPHHGGVIDDSKPETPVIAAQDLTEEEKIAAEMARMNRTFKRGGHNVSS